MSDSPHELLEAAEVRILRLEPGDEIVLNVKTRITSAQADELRRYAQEQWPEHKIVVLSDGVELEVIRGHSTSWRSET